MWNPQGLGKSKPRKTSGKMGGIPFISSAIVRSRLKHGAKVVDKVEKKIHDQLTKASRRVDSIVHAAENTDSHTLIEKADELKQRVDSLCPADGGGGGKAVKVADPRLKCKRAIFVAVGRGVQGAEGDLAQYIDACASSGSVVIPAKAKGNKKGVDVTVDMP